ncbi:MAG TPA: thiamine pyrophosphate-dependent enzyme [Candidatus Methylomirabilis sp.]|nr:thiamine pyrophosphate-dependent enzyme [Candidatus Methylomirabilis sp.]
MVKQLLIVPEEVRRSETIDLGTIPVNAYKQTLAEEIAAANLTAADAVRLYRDMWFIREFETMLDEIKRLRRYRDIVYTHQGPAHLSIGQEAAAVGEAFLLGAEDHIFGSHRCHGEVLAKGLAAIHRLDELALQRIMEGYLDGDILRVVEREPAASGAERAIDYLLYGLLAEIFGRATGFNRGLGGSMHAFFPPFGIYPNNAIVGGSADIAVGAALWKKVQRQPGLVIVNIGDASLGCGPVWEALHFSAMGQFWTLWEPEYRGGPPLIFAIMDNFYGMGGQTRGETMGFARLATVAAGLNPWSLHAETVDGNNPLAVIDAIRRKQAVLAAGEGPVLLDILTYRQSGHSPSDAGSYRTREEVQLWQAVDPLREYRGQLLGAGVASQAELDDVAAYAARKILAVCRLAVDPRLSPRLQGEAIARVMFSDQRLEPPGGARPDALRKPLEQNSRVQAIAKKSRSGIDPATGERLSEAKAVSFRDALFEAVIAQAYRDERLVIYGEENRDWDGAFAVYRGLTESLPYHRLFNAPISEGAIVGTAVGYAMEGGRPLVELMYCDFLGRAGDEIFNQLAKWQAMSAGVLRMPVVLRVSVGSKYGAQHSQDWSAMTAHIPGLKVVFPATPYDAKGLMAAALQGSDPVVFFESQRLYGITEWFRPEVPAGSYTVPIGLPEVKRPGADLTILSIGSTLYRAMETADRLRQEFGLSAEVVDARSLVPFDYGPVLESVRKTGRILLTSDACERGSYPQVLAATIQELAYDALDAPAVVVGARNWITPAAEMEELFFPQSSWLLDAIHAHLRPLPGYRPQTDRSVRGRLARERGGV